MFRLFMRGRYGESPLTVAGASPVYQRQTDENLLHRFEKRSKLHDQRSK